MQLCLADLLSSISFRDKIIMCSNVILAVVTCSREVWQSVWKKPPKMLPHPRLYDF